MLAKVIKVGNSKGIRIPSALLKKCNIYNQVELYIQGDNIVIKPIHQVRNGWDESFKNMHKNGDDKLIMNDQIDSEMVDWEWN